MTEIFLSVFFISILLLFLSTGVWVALSMIGVSTIAMTIFTSRPVGDAMATTIWGTSSSWTLTALPLFVWMGKYYLEPNYLKIFRKAYLLDKSYLRFNTC